MDRNSNLSNKVATSGANRKNISYQRHMMDTCAKSALAACSVYNDFSETNKR
jgi:hypothetical protein